MKYCLHSFLKNYFGIKSRKIAKKSNRLSKIAIISFLISLILFSLLISATIINRTNVEKLKIEQLILEKSLQINKVISKLLYKTETLATLVIEKNGDVDNNNFEKIASSIVDSDPAILNVIIAPNGIVSNVYPLTDNEVVIGLNFFGEGAGNKEAVTARDSGELVLSGPFITVEGVVGIAGRLPVFIDTQTEKHKFWGIVTILLKFPEVLENAELKIFKTQGFAYELWRINPDTNEKQVIEANYAHDRSNSSIVEKQVTIMNANWYLRVWPVRIWYIYPENWVLIFAGFIICFLVASITQNNYKLRIMKSALEDMAKTDPLTGIYNRRYFIEGSEINIERAKRLKSDCYIILFDLDKFKNVNDTYGHIIGDKVLIETTLRIKSTIRPYDLFARYGGEEFIILVSDVNKSDINGIVERLRLKIFNKKFEYENISFNLSASFGVALVSDYDLAKTIGYADEALYVAKEKGRNRVIFYGDY